MPMKRRSSYKSSKKPVKRAKVASNVILPPISGKAYDPERIFRFKRRQTDTFVLVYNGTAANTYKGIDFQLDKAEQYADLVNMFDQYRITAIKVQIIPRCNVLDPATQSATFTAVPPLIVVVDLDDANTPTDWRDLISHDSCKIIDPFKNYTFTFRPKLAQSQYGATAFGQYGVTESTQWMNAASDDIEYYGLKLGSMTYSTGNNDTYPPAWDLIYTYHIECRYPK